VGISFATAAAKGLDAPKGVWIGLAITAAAVFLVAIVMHVRTPLSAGVDVQFATDKHASELDAMLLDALTAVEGGNARAKDDPLAREMFALHFAALDETLLRWDETNIRRTSAPGRLESRFLQELQEQELDETRYAPSVIAREFTDITRRRSLRGELETPLPAAFGTPDSIWRAWPTAHPMGGTITFRNEGRGQGPAVHMPFGSLSDEEFEAEFAARLPELVAPLLELLNQAQKWSEASEERVAVEELRAFPKEGLCEAIKKMRLKPHFPTVDGCPGCQ